MTQESQTYIATRRHPTLGELVKVEKSTNVQKRLWSLGCANGLVATLPRACESELKALLSQHRVWKDSYHHPYREHWEHPVFNAPSEWFYYTPAVKHFIRAYVRFRHGKSLENKTPLPVTVTPELEHFLDTEPDPERME